MERAGFEPTKAEPTDLQSAPVDRLGTSPYRHPPLFKFHSMERAGFEPTKAEPTDLQSAPVDRLGTSPKLDC